MRVPRKYKERFIEGLLFTSAITSILVMLLIFYFLIRESFPAFAELGIFSLLTGQKWHPAGDIYGLLPLIATSLIITLLALFINIIIGFPLAIYLAELAGPRSKAHIETSHRAAGRCAFNCIWFLGSDHSCILPAG